VARLLQRLGRVLKYDPLGWLIRRSGLKGGPVRMSLKQDAMRTFDFAPLYRSTVGFERMFSMLDQLDGVEGLSNYPPYNIEQTGENAYRISVAVAGFTDADLSIETKENRLAIRGEKQANDAEKTGEVLYQGMPREPSSVASNSPTMSRSGARA
jgi:Hsp20/alpha crystallin family